jgi:hypothetical protein
MGSRPRRRVLPKAAVSGEDAYVDTRDVPDHILDQLLVALVFFEAELTLHHFTPGETAVISESFGTVFAWLWRENPVKATILVADFLAQLCFYHPTANRAVTLEAVLRGLPPSLRGVPPDEVAEMQELLRRDVPMYVGQADI